MPREKLADLNVVATFQSMEAARSAILALERAGVDEDDISILGRAAAESNKEAQQHPEIRDKNVATDVAKTAATGTAAGASLGAAAGLIGGALAFGIPGIGPVIGSGIWAATLGGAGVGAAVGGLVSGTAVLGQDETWAETYQESVRAGRVLVAVSCAARDGLRKSASILRDQQPLKLEYVDGAGRPVPEPNG